MPSPTRPGVVPIWTVGNTPARTQPTNGEQFAGFSPNFRPPAEWHNWLFGEMSDWIAWLDFATQGNGPVSNVGHNILTGTTVQAQFDETDAFLSSLGLQPLTMSVTGNPLIYNVTPLPLNGSQPLIFLDGLDELPTTDFTWAVVSGVGTVTFAVAPSGGQTPIAIGLTANNPGSGGSSQTGGYVAYGSGASGILVAATGMNSTADQRALIFTVSSGGAVPITGNPQISAGSKIGQELRVVGTSDTDYITFATGTGLLLNGPISMKNGVTLDLYWNGSVWAESDRSN